ncbi:MAG: four-helix bundle copper-binding protein [Armatimonadetes bacterium]|nr:four-helix bundle copper-binding protein [Armatimonadota bacterium]
MQNTQENESYSAIEALEECLHTCSDCASHDIRHGAEMAACALICLDCADICAATLKVMARHSVHHGDFARLAAHICRECAKECARHDHEHCKKCAAACEKCAAECEKHAGEADM